MLTLLCRNSTILLVYKLTRSKNREEITVISNRALRKSRVNRRSAHQICTSGVPYYTVAAAGPHRAIKSAILPPTSGVHWTAGAEYLTLSYLKEPIWDPDYVIGWIFFLSRIILCSGCILQLIVLLRWRLGNICVEVYLHIYLSIY
jgi:hypothetical protein